MRSRLEDAISRRLDTRRSQSTLRQLTTNPPNSVDFSSNDFLSLSSSPDLRQSYLHELQHSPSASSLGSGGSRLLDGNSRYAEQLERDIAAFHGAAAGLLCNSGYDANVSLFSCLPQPGDLILYDELIHASVHDGMRLSRAGRRVPFAHNDTSSLRTVLQACVDEDAALRRGERSVFVAVEAVYSMDGDVAPLSSIATLLASLLPAQNAHLIVDEAHSTGVFGPQGRGLVSSLALEAKATIRLHTFGKALASTGAIILCSPLIRQYLINYARPLIYTTFMSHPALAAIRSSYTMLWHGRSEALVQNLRALIAALHHRLLDLEASLRLPAHQRHFLRVPAQRPQSAISYVLSSQPKALAAYCQRRGFVVRGIVYPTVPAGTERIRICLHAGNTVAEVEGLVGAIGKWVEGRAKGAEGEGVSVRANL